MKKHWIYIMGLLYILAGINHFINPSFYLKMMPEGFPLPLESVYVSGIVEILLGLGLFFNSTRRFAAWGLIVLLVVIFPANINMALHADLWNKPAWILYLRLPLQLLFIYWAYLCTKTRQL